METGANGVNGALVLRHANRGNNQEHENVIPHLLSMVEKHAVESQRKPVSATRMCLVQVNNQYYLLICTQHKELEIIRIDVLHRQLNT